MTDIFISYSSKDEQLANELCAFFEKEQVSCWIAPRNIGVGKEYGGEIIKGIEGSKVFFLCLSNAANESQHVLREVERAVSRKLPIVVYQVEETTLSKSMEYFLASTQWFVPGKDNGYEELVEIIKSIRDKKQIEKKVTNKPQKKMKPSKWIWGLCAIPLILAVLGVVFLPHKKETSVVIGETITYGRIDLTGNSEEDLEWTILNVDEENVLCIADKIVAFFPYDGAESGMRSKAGDVYFNQEKADEYTDEQLRQFWGSSDWESSNIRSWLNSDEAIVSYEGAYPTEDAMSLYENGYENQAGFLYLFTEEEKQQLVENTVDNGKDKVYLLSLKEVEEYLVDQNFLLSAVAGENAVLLEGTGAYKEYYDKGERGTYWATRTEGDSACEIICAGPGLSKTENFHSEYACASLTGIRPVIVLPKEYVANLIAKENE